MTNKIFKIVPVFLCLFVLFNTSCKKPYEFKKPNILFCIADDASFPFLGAYGCNWVETPAFDRVASEGILFNNAYTCNAKCAPSRASILTGRNSWQLEEACNHSPYFPEKFKSIVEALNENGYQVGYTGKGWAPGEPGTIDGIRRELTGKPYNSKLKTKLTKGISPIDYAENFKDFLNENSGEPWFFWYGGHEPHRVYEFESGISVGKKSLSSIDQVPDFWPDNKIVRADMLDYALEVEYFDHELGKILQTIEDLGEIENTLIIVTSDNGMPFPRIKGQEYEMSNHLPMAIRWDNGIANPGRSVDDLISFIDIAPTIADVAGLDWSGSGMQAAAGKSITNILQSPKDGMIDSQRNFVLIGKERHDVGRPDDQGYPIRGIVKEGYLFVRNFEIER